MILTSCDCGKEIKTYPSRLKAGRGKYCSRRCANLSVGAFYKGHKINLGRKQSSDQIIQRTLHMHGEEHPNWKGDKARYRTIHTWVQSKLGKANYCTNNPSHIASRYHWSNISGEYKRDLSDWHSLCPSCNYSDGIHVPERLRVQLF